MNVELKMFGKDLMEQCGVDLDHILPDLYDSNRLPVSKWMPSVIGLEI